MADARRVLVVDNHDSFVHTLVGYLHELGAVTDMVEADAVDDPERAIVDADGVLILLVLAAAVLYGLFWYVFPWAAQFITPQDSTIGG